MLWPTARRGWEMPSQVSVGSALGLCWRSRLEACKCSKALSSCSKPWQQTDSVCCWLQHILRWNISAFDPDKKKKPVETNQYSWGDLLHLTEEQTCDVSSLQPQPFGPAEGETTCFFPFVTGHVVEKLRNCIKIRKRRRNLKETCHEAALDAKSCVPLSVSCLCMWREDFRDVSSKLHWEVALADRLETSELPCSRGGRGAEQSCVNFAGRIGLFWFSRAGFCKNCPTEIKASMNLLPKEGSLFSKKGTRGITEHPLQLIPFWQCSSYHSWALALPYGKTGSSV